MTATTSRADWLAWRAGGLGASDIAAILGLSPWSSPWSLWAEKTGLTGGPDETDEMEAGRWLELAIGPWFADTTGLTIAGEQTACQHPEHEWARATVDGFVFETPGLIIPGVDPSIDNAIGLLEIKTAQPGRRWDDIPPHYQTQAQWQMFVTGLPQVWFAVLHGRRLDVYELARDDADIAVIFDAAHAFWFDHVLTGVPPAVDGSEATLRAIGEVYPDSDAGQAVEVDDATADALTTYLAAKASIAGYETIANEAKARIELALGDAEVGTLDGRKVVSWKTQTARRLDGAALKKAHPELAAEFTTESTSRVLRTHTPKENP